MFYYFTVDIPENELSICRFDPDDGIIVKSPPIPGVDVNSLISNPYCGFVTPIPVLLNQQEFYLAKLILRLLGHN